ncbi:MAG: hypothetical protein COA45_04665 [Zetaproteobacteria bacterium]|nr:MAG: hypothetical protein COA45_04665 [Zetaproteobacteria bacterium]
MAIFNIEKNKLFKRLIAGLLLAVFTTNPCVASATDIYLVYSGANRDIKNQIQDALSSELDIKSYNTSLLVIADYSGKQKVIAKLSQAGLVVMLDENSIQDLDNSAFENVVHAIDDDIMSNIDLIISHLYSNKDR